MTKRRMAGNAITKPGHGHPGFDRPEERESPATRELGPTRELAPRRELGEYRSTPTSNEASNPNPDGASTGWASDNAPKQSYTDYLTEKKGDMQVSASSDVVKHSQPDTTVSTMSYGTAMESPTGIRSDTGLGGADWSNYWKAANRSGREAGYDDFGLNTAQKFIDQGSRNQVIDTSSLQGRMDKRENYYNSKATTTQNDYMGDWRRTKTTDWQQATPLEPIGKPDLDPQNYLDQILDIELNSKKKDKEKPTGGSSIFN